MRWLVIKENTSMMRAIRDDLNESSLFVFAQYITWKVLDMCTCDRCDHYNTFGLCDLDGVIVETDAKGCWRFPGRPIILYNSYIDFRCGDIH